MTRTHLLLACTRRHAAAFCTALLLLSGGQSALAQSDPAPPITEKSTIVNLLKDQKEIWTSPLAIRRRHIKFLVPFAITTAGLIASDAEVSRQVQRKYDFGPPSNLNLKLSDAGLIGLVGVAGSLYTYGKIKHDNRAKETGLLAAEAATDTAIASYLLKTAFGRSRPFEDPQGPFRNGGASFPSEHASLTWAIAAVLAHEYPSPFMKLLSYGTASAVSIARVNAQQHFPADVFVGGVMGYMIGKHVYDERHVDDDGTSARYGRFVKTAGEETTEPTSNTFVPIDSWVYPQLDRLIGAGHIKSNLSGLRPWTRRECARLIEEAMDDVGVDSTVPVDGSEGLSRLRREFAVELDGGPEVEITTEDAYARGTFIGGQSLADGFHFAQTITNDYGRPFADAANAIVGTTQRAVIGPFGVYVRGEYQHAAPLQPYGASVLSAIATADETPTALQPRTASLNRFRILDAYVSLTLKNNVLTFGKQSLWWGPGDSPFLFSNNAEPLPMLRYTQQSPFHLPWIFSLMGPTKVEFMWAQMGGQHFISLLDPSGSTRTSFSDPIRPHPYLQGEKISFKPTRNLELGFGVTTIFSGPGFPFTARTLLRSYSISNASVGAPNDPGDRRSAFDFNYRVPWLRDRVSLYGDSFAEDEFSPIAYPRRSAWRAGLFLPRLPFLQNVDLHTEGVYTDLPNLRGPAGSYYHNDHYLSGYTNYGDLIGNWVGREGRGFHAWSNVWLKEGRSLRFAYRSQHVNPAFLEGGELQDARFGMDTPLKHGFNLTAFVQYEHWNFPLLSTSDHSNVSTSVEIAFRPLGGLRLFK